MSDRRPDESQVISFLQLLDAKVERLDQRLDNVDRTLIKQEINLEKHILRTNIAEENIELVRSELQKMDNDLVPVRRHVAMVETTLKVLGMLAGATLTVLGVTTSILKILAYIQS